MGEKFVVTGCGRSGTTFTAHLFQKLGVDARHEAFFPYIKRRYPGVFYNRNTHKYQILALDWGSYDSEIAWQAAPFLSWLKPSVPVLHQLRHPMAFVRSRIAKGMTHADLRDRYSGVRVGALRAADMNTAAFEDKVRYLADFWVSWNALVEKNARGPYMRQRVEDLTADSFGEVLSHVGHAAEPQAVREAFGEVPANTNTRTSAPGTDVGWSVLTPDALGRLQVACDRYGYDLTP